MDKHSYPYDHQRTDEPTTSHWVYVNGVVLFGNHLSDLAEQAGAQSGLSDMEARRIGNLIARSQFPQGDVDVALGVINYNSPNIWQSNVDRNHVWDVVSEAWKTEDATQRVAKVATEQTVRRYITQGMIDEPDGQLLEFKNPYISQSAAGTPDGTPMYELYRNGERDGSIPVKAVEMYVQSGRLKAVPEMPEQIGADEDPNDLGWGKLRHHIPKNDAPAFKQIPADMPRYQGSTHIAMADRTGVPEIDALIEEYLKTPMGDWTTDDNFNEKLKDPAEAAGACHAVSEDFAAFAKARGFDVAVTMTDLDEMGYKPSIDPQGEVMNEDGEIVMGFYPEHTVNEFYRLPDGTKLSWPIVVDWTASQYGYKDHPKVSSAKITADQSNTDWLVDWFGGPDPPSPPLPSPEEEAKKEEERQKRIDEYRQDMLNPTEPDRLMKYAEQVSVEALIPASEFNRRPDAPMAKDYYQEGDEVQQAADPEHWNDLKQSIEQYGINSPIILQYNPDTGEAYISEGNHRLGIAQELGIESVPVVVYRSQRGVGHGGAHIQLETPWRDEPYVPQYIKPSQVGLHTSSWQRVAMSLNPEAYAKYPQQATAYEIQKMLGHFKPWNEDEGNMVFTLTTVPLDKVGVYGQPQLETYSQGGEWWDQPDIPNSRGEGYHQQLEQAIQNQEDVPPLLLIPSGDRYESMDGYHRASIARSLGFTEFPAYVYDPSQTTDNVREALPVEWSQSVEQQPAQETPANTQDFLTSNRGQNLQGLPEQPINIPGWGKIQFGSDINIQNVANSYMDSIGMPDTHFDQYVKSDPEVATNIAGLYDKMEHNPHDPKVKASYDAMIKETLDQYNHIVDNGYTFEFYPEGQNPYPNSPREAVLDLNMNKHMYVFPTEVGYGSEDENPEDHPLLGDSGIKWNGKTVTFNDLFRAVHDFYGHAKEGVGFRADGEENAWVQHSAMYSPLARQAMTAETRGQNSWVNYGPYGEQNQTANQEETIYAPQKAGLLPEWVSEVEQPRQSSWRRVTSEFRDVNPNLGGVGVLKALGWTLLRKTSKGHGLWGWTDDQGGEHTLTVGMDTHGKENKRKNGLLTLREAKRCMLGRCEHAVVPDVKQQETEAQPQFVVGKPVNLGGHEYTVMDMDGSLVVLLDHLTGEEIYWDTQGQQRAASWRRISKA